uniref:NADH dehydrogenase subunit 5 n=1 Tax=Ornithodoros phacochoerus TaxID=1580574 RepID=UPI000739261C|nr:NADH dehydrogenase subunit 5 [Ornithodoros phacochoerus]AIZ58644.1 NADH dehydrogenase subunit 5 [Ornithodoros phacochoerus]UYL27152.1 NADH dehydrogenase subunit 5 [Ornithodoros phacochoerus]
MFFSWGLLLVLLSLCFFLGGFVFLVKLSVVIVEYYLYFFGNFELKFFFLFDWMSMMFCSVVLFISGMVVIYSNDYMSMDKFKIYFCYGVLLFIGSMLLMIMSPNLMMILLGWDGLGLVSYALVIFYQNYNSNSAGMMTVMSNRVGDVMILLSLVYMLNFGVLDFHEQAGCFMLVGMMMIFVGMTKSAQIPFSAWLPAAMAAPTPVSALVHSSTLVTAGVYLLIRLSLIFQIEMFSKFLLYISLGTALMAGLGAILETDLKKIIALSTLSQLGLMMIILSLGKEDLAFFHLLTHAVFKAMLFLCAGFMIHSSLGIQDIRFFGGFMGVSPLVSVSFSVANMSLFGVPFLSGFYSKDLILESIYEKNCNFFVILGIVVATVCTCIYSLRVMYYIVWSESGKMTVFFIGWSSWMEIPVFFMGLMVLVFGAVFGWILFPNYEVGLIFLNLKMINVVILLVGLWSFFFVYFGEVGKLEMKVNNFLGSMWFMSTFSGPMFLFMMLMGESFSSLDMGWVEEFGPQGLFGIKSFFAVMFQWFQMSSLKSLFAVVIIFLLFNF